MLHFIGFLAYDSSCELVADRLKPFAASGHFNKWTTTVAVVNPMKSLSGSNFQQAKGWLHFTSLGNVILLLKIMNRNSKSSLAKKISRLWDNWYPFVFGIGAVLLYLAFFHIVKFNLPNTINQIFSTAASICGILVGFLITSMSILLSIDAERFKAVKILVNSKAYNKLINYFMFATQWAFIAAISSMVGIPIENFNDQRTLHLCIFLFWLFSFVVAVTSCHRIIWVFTRILRI